MDHLAENLERLRRSVDARVEQLLIKRNVGTTSPLPDLVSGQSELALQSGVEPSITPLGVDACPTREAAQRFGAAPHSETTRPRTPNHGPAVSEQSFLRRIHSLLGF